MNGELWAGFAIASLIVGLLPGPGVTSIVGYALTAGLRTALASVFGATLGNAVAMALSLVGVGVLLADSPGAFFLLKWIGAAYLVVLGGYTMLAARRGSLVADRDVGAIRPRTAFWGTFAITSINPKTIIFFVAFTPQFISPDHGYWLQAALLLATFSAVVTLSDGFYAVAASWIAGFLKGPDVRLWSQRIGGSVLIAAGLLTVAASA
ncbi:LysE family translocator [Sphingomonas parva]|uniref:LysE family translocator n=1 Tax=Sphingomonas parva TaxID=2555898 RepID=A0A4Y8ZZ36_9SPHN|nr:LysE family translocator [Sphingomonas parva]TFI60329.1 LysE family translocator [Sphingomonas parva]